jgi:hypothetical protein
MALTTEDLQQVENYLSGKGIHISESLEFPKADDKIPVLRGSEGKYITTENLTNYVKTHDINPTYAELKALVNSGKFFDVYECGQAINVDFTYNGTTYAFPFQVAHDSYRETIRPDGTVRNSVPLLATYLPPMTVQFSQYRAFLACPQGLAAGSYKVTFAQAWSKLTTLEWYFTLTHAVPAGGRLNAFHNFADGQGDTSVRTYGADGKLLYTDATVTSTAIDGATDLGTMNYTTRNGNFSSMQECFYGCNEYHTSAKKQFMDSDKAVNLWWAPQDEWDCAPDALSSYGGLLSYFDPDFVDILETVKVTTAKSTALGAASADYDTDYLRCFLPSMEEMYITPQASTGMEGAYLQLAKDYVGKDSPNGWYSSNANTGLIRYDIISKGANWFHLRSASRGYSCNVWDVSAVGYVDNGYARSTYGVLPLVYI